MADDYPKIKVFLALVIGLIAFGFAPILVRATPETPPLVLATYRTALAALLVAPFWIYRHVKIPSTRPKEDKLLVAFAGFCLGMHFCFWIASLYYTSVASASVLVTIHPVILILVERFWFKRRFAWTTWLGVLLAFSGSVLLGITDSQIDQDFKDPLFGNMLAFSAALIFVVYLLIGQKIRQKREWLDYVSPVYFFAAVSCIALTVLVGSDLTNISYNGVMVGLGLAFGPQILGHGSMNYAVKFVSPTLLSTLVLAEPLLASVLAFFLFAELPPTASIVAMVIILSGVGLTWRKKAIET